MSPHSDKKCRACAKGTLQSFLSLGDVPPVNAFIPASEVSQEIAYPLNLSFCQTCFLVQLEDIVPPERLFSRYLHLSSASASNRQHLEEVACHLQKRLSLTSSTNILEFGSNDGTLLSYLRAITPHLLGVDPAENLAELSRKKGIDTKTAFLNSAVAQDILNSHGAFDLLIGLNVIPHTPGVTDLLRGVRTLLKPDGLLVMEGVYALETILKGEFDTIYHEHVYSFSLHSLLSTFEVAGLKVWDVEKLPTQGGSLRVYASRTESPRPRASSVTDMLEREKELGLVEPGPYQRVEKLVNEFKTNLLKMVAEEKKNGKLIGLGAPARGVVILNYTGLSTADVQCLIDDTTLKQNLLTPGVHIPVKGWDAVQTAKNESFLLLSWNYRDDMLKRLQKLKPRARVIVPFPSLEVVQLG